MEMYSMDATFSLSVLQTAATQHFIFFYTEANTSAMLTSLPPWQTGVFLNGHPHAKLLQAQTVCATF